MKQAVFVNITGALIKAGANLTGLNLSGVENDRLKFKPGSTGDFQKSIVAGTNSTPQTFKEAGFLEYGYNRTPFLGDHKGFTDYMVRQSVETNSVQVGFGKKGAFADIDLWNPDKNPDGHEKERNYNSKNKAKTPHFYLAKILGNCK